MYRPAYRPAPHDTAAQAAPVPGPDDASAAAAASRGLDSALAAADAALDLAERTHSAATGADPIDWGRLQPVRNTLALALVCIPFGGPAAASRTAAAVSDAIAARGAAGAALAPAGAVAICAGAVAIGAYVPGPVGGACRAVWHTAAATARAVRRVCRSRLGWIITRPVIWAAVCAGLILTWHAITRTLTGAS